MLSLPLREAGRIGQRQGEQLFLSDAISLLNTALNIESIALMLAAHSGRAQHTPLCLCGGGLYLFTNLNLGTSPKSMHSIVVSVSGNEDLILLFINIDPEKPEYVSIVILNVAA